MLPAPLLRAEITVFAAASLQGALTEIAATYDQPVRLSFAGSGTIARQVAAGAPVDAVVLAHPVWMDWLVQRGNLLSSRPVSVAGNRLVLIAPGSADDMQGLDALPGRLGQDRLAMGQRDAVPAGIYARQWLERAGLWDAVRPQLAETDNVRAALTLVARGEAPFGIVYATDAAATSDVTTLLTAPRDAHDPIRYPAAALTPAGQAFVTHLQGADAVQILQRHGFTEPPE